MVVIYSLLGCGMSMLAVLTGVLEAYLHGASLLDRHPGVVVLACPTIILTAAMAIFAARATAD